jgi:hypothetical protein
VKLFEECREQEEEEEEGKNGTQHGQCRKVVAGGGCWVSATASS